VASEDALVGYSGFVGGNLCRQHQFDALFNSRNVAEIEGRDFELLVISAAQAKKWWANLHPQEDWAGIERLLVSLERVKARRVVLISTIDVLPPLPGIDEDFDTHAPREHHAYGTHRLRLEDAVKARFAETSVVRLPGLFGHDLKKNVIHDLLTGNQLEKINPASSFQYYDLEALWGDIELILSERLPLIHLFTEPVATSEIVERFFPGAEVGGDAGPAVHYLFRTKYAGLFGGCDGYIWPREEVLRRMGKFIEGYRSGNVQ
jgi:hypothetical protein